MRRQRQDGTTLTANFAAADLDRLTAIREEFLELLYEARRLLKRQGGPAYERAQFNWLTQIETALKNEPGFVSGSRTTMEDTLAELRKFAEGSITESFAPAVAKHFVKKTH